MSKLRSQYISEGVLIIVSILIAFAIDAWWEERQQRLEETRILEALRAEFEQNADELPWHIDIRRSNAEHAVALIEEVQAAGGRGTVSVTPAQLTALTVHGSFDPIRGAFDAMLQSGDLRYIQNKELRQRLVQWPSLVADAIENDFFLRTVSAPRAVGYLAGRVDLGLVDQIFLCQNRNPTEECPSASFELEATRELSSVVSRIRGWSAEGARELESVRQEALGLVRALDEELAKR
jgi:hypothetical protein